MQIKRLFWLEVEVAGKRTENSDPCPFCGSRSVRKNGSSRGHPRLHCRDCGKSFGPTFGTPLYGLRTSAEEIARTLLIVLRRGSLSAGEEVSGHKYETIADWLHRVGDHADALTGVLVRDLELEEVEVDAFWSFVRNGSQALKRGHVRNKRWPSQLREGHAGDA